MSHLTAIRGRRLIADSCQLKAIIRRGELLSHYTSLGIGGPADFFASPRTPEEIEELLSYARGLKLPWMVLGNGTNVLFPDEGYRGLVIHLGRNFSAKRLRDNRLFVQAGAGLGATIGYLRAQGFYDFNGFVGIPGTIGGALTMNAGIPEVTISEYVHSVTVLTDEGFLLRLSREECGFEYRGSLFQRRPWVILEGEFQLGGARRFDLEGLMQRRRERQPIHDRSAGCVFKNPPGPFTAGQLIERAGLKGLAIGGAMISSVHANFIVNLGWATARDVLRLIDFAREKVYKEFRVELRLELVVVSNQR